MPLKDYSTITPEQVDSFACTLARRDVPFIERLEPIADFEELATFATENPTPVVHPDRNPIWRLESVAARLIEALAVASHESTILDTGWNRLAQIILEYAEYLYTYQSSPYARERLAGGAALALVSCVCRELPQSTTWRLVGFSRIAEAIETVEHRFFQAHLVEPIDAAFEMATEFDLLIPGEAIDRYNETLNRNLQGAKRAQFKLNDLDFFELLDLDYPGLEKVKSKFRQGDIERAKSAYVSFLHDKIDHFKPCVALQAQSESTNPRVGESHNLQSSIFNFQLWRSWFDQFPVLDVPCEPQWSVSAAGSRAALKWPEIFITGAASPDFRNRIGFDMAKSYLEHALFLAAHTVCHPSTGHAAQMATSGLAVAALLFPEWRDSEGLLKLALRRYKWIRARYLFPDGFHVGGASAHRSAFAYLSSVHHIARQSRPHLFHELAGWLEKAIEVFMYLSQPDYHLPLLGDCVEYIPIKAPCRVGHTFFNREDFRYMAFEGKSGAPPVETSHAFPHAGYYVMRDNWRADAHYLVFDGGTFGLSPEAEDTHMLSEYPHEDKLNFVLYAYGRPLIVDPGVCRGDDNFARYFRSSRGHNSLMIDGQGQCRRFMTAEETIPDPDTRWLTTPAFDFVESWYKDGYAGEEGNGVNHDLQHKRSIFYVKGKTQRTRSTNGEYFILHDLVLGEGEHQLEQIFHIAPAPEGCSGRVEFMENSVVRTVAPGVSNIVIVPVDACDLDARLQCGETDPVVGWMGTSGRIPAHDLTYATVRSLPTVMNVVLFPLGPRVELVPDVKPLEVGAAADVLATGFTVANGRFTDLILISDDGFATMRTSPSDGNATPDVEFAGEYLFIRLDARGEPQRIVTMSGQFLKVDGRVWVDLPEPQDNELMIRPGSESTNPTNNEEE